jgi:hypothetical protein
MDRLTLPASHYGYSATRLGDLGATAYSMVTIAADCSGSVMPFRTDIEGAIANIVRACRTSPRADHLMLRVLAFDDEVREIHGFKPLTECAESSYDGALKAGGLTALHDAALNAVEAQTAYATTLAAHGFDVNGVVFVVTDGCDNASSASARDVARALSSAVTSEALRSMTSALIGIGTGQQLMSFSSRAGFDSYVELADATPAELARLSSFVSRSIALTSTALAQGSAPKVLSL